MLLLCQRVLTTLGQASQPLPLSHEQRRRSRYRIRFNENIELGWALPTGSSLEPGDYLQDERGELFEVQAAVEQVLSATTDDPRLLARAAWHLGNRHVQIEVGDGVIRLQPDSVLASMLVGLGLQVSEVRAPFHPESGAYAGGHRHGHAESFAADHALAQAVFELRADEGNHRRSPLLPHGPRRHE